MAQTPDIALPASATRALSILEEGGFEAWCVGGFVRDSLRGAAVHDIDVATSAPWEEAARLFRAAGCAVHETGAAFGTVTAVVGGSAIEVTTYRSDGAYRDARHPESVSFVGTIDEDLARRDFTVNAIAFHPARGIRDPFSGADDLRRGVIRAVGDPSRRFSEDALRILRGARFASQLGFSVDRSTARAMDEHAALLRKVAVERVFAEMGRLLLGQGACGAIVAHWRALAAVLPELAAMAGCPQNTPYHIYDVLGHTAHVVAESPATPLSRWAALFHDSGKPACRTTDARGRDHFKGHAHVGAAIARAALLRLKAPSKLVEDVSELVDRHEWYTGGDDASVRRALRKLGGRADLYRALLDLQIADSRAKAPGVTERLAAARAARAGLERVMAAGEPFTVRQLAVDGHDLMAAGWEAGPALGAALEDLLDRVIDGSLENTRPALLGYASAHRPTREIT